VPFVKELRSSVDIDASPSTVWAVLTDFDSYADWNPVEISMKGEAVVGAVIEHTAQLSGRKPMTFRPTVITAIPNEELAWKGKVLLPGIFDVVHQFRLEPIANGGTRLHQNERFRGLLIPVSGATLSKTAEAFERANAAIKARAEALK
jgi:hypothetical protein